MFSFTFNKADQKISIDSARERFRDFEKVWKIQILQMANVDAPKLPDGKFLDGRVGIRVSFCFKTLFLSFFIFMRVSYFS